MISIKEVFEWPVKKVLKNEKKPVNRTRIKIISIALLFRILTTAISTLSLFYDKHWQEGSRMLLILILLIAACILIRKGLITWETAVHLILISVLLFIWSSIFISEENINLVTTQIILLLLIYSNYLFDNGWRFIYSFGGIFPVILYIFFDKDKLSPPFPAEEIGRLSYFINVVHNFAFIFITNFYFATSFKKTINQLEVSRDELGRQTQIQKRLIAGITHDIKTPLKYLMLTMRGVFKNSEYKDFKLKEDLKDAYSSSFKVYHLTENVLQYAKVYLNESITKSPVNLHQLVNDKIGVFSDVTKWQFNRVYNFIDPNTMLKTNKSCLAVIVHNLLENSVKFTFAGTIIFSAGTDNKNTILTIFDSGSGMSEDLLNWYNGNVNNMAIDTIPFHLGLGLTTVEELLKKIEGRMNIESNKDIGTYVTLILPNRLQE